MKFDTESYEWPLAELQAVLIVCDFIHRMTLSKEVSRLIVETNERLSDQIWRAMVFGNTDG